MPSYHEMRSAACAARGGMIAERAGVKKLVERAIHEHENHEHGGKHTKIKLKHGGHVEGEMPKARHDRRAHGGKVKGPAKVSVNVIVPPAPHSAAPSAPMAAGLGGPPGAMPPRPPMAPPPGAMPMKPPGLKHGGVPRMTAGARSGEGRLEKMRAQEREEVEA